MNYCFLLKRVFYQIFQWCFCELKLVVSENMNATYTAQQQCIVGVVSFSVKGILGVLVLAVLSQNCNFLISSALWVLTDGRNSAAFMWTEELVSLKWTLVVPSCFAVM